MVRAIKEIIIGVVSAILGSVATMITTKILKQWGKLKFYFTKYECKNNYDDGMGGYVEEVVNDAKELKNSRVNMKVEIYNSCELPKIMREINIVMCDKKIFKQRKYHLIPFDADNRISTNHPGANATYISIKPFEYITKELSFYINSKEQVDNVNRIYIEFKNENDRTKKHLITKNVIKLEK